ncbi:MAG: aminotransferase class V-fold PLP-dependent enzyme [Saprospiraceae bacterium]|nr:aminotransferase class V-fold PLP-dependent enzyme [Saprospiraceae bacterium]|tara:strand:- start:438 stop:1724 length:1287 start_codon:yes stop_codon:yes gene_type:complete
MKKQIPLKTRRKFIGHALVGMASSMAIPSYSRTSDGNYGKSLKINTEALDEHYWEMVKSQFSIPKGKIMVNAANLCPSPFVVTDAVIRHTRSLEKDVSFQNRDKFSDIRTEALKLMGEYLGAEASEIGITRNTSEGNNIIVNGLDFEKSDEVIVWNQNHPTNHVAWQQRAKREGFSVKIIKMPENPKSKSDLLDAIKDSISDKTRLIAFSHISNVSGIAMPAAEICELAKSKGILTLIDGAQSFGIEKVNLKQIGCDFYTGSAHKWLMGPKETGIIFVRGERIDEVWPSVISAGWKEDWKTVDEKLCVLGQRNPAAASALVETINFHNDIGNINIQKRVRALTNFLKEQIQDRIPGSSFVTPKQEEISGGIVIFKMKDRDSIHIFQKLYENYGIASAPSGGIRFSPNIYNTMADMEMVVDVLSELNGG